MDMDLPGQRPSLLNADSGAYHKRAGAAAARKIIIARNDAKRAEKAQ